MAYNMPTTVHLGLHEFDKISNVFPTELGNKVLVIIDQVISELGYRQKISKQITAETIFFSDFNPNPTTAQVQACLELAKEEEPTTIISIGGGTTMDVGKVTAFLYPQVVHVKEFFKQDYADFEKGVSFIAVPTTAGTGAEVTCWASLWENKMKYSISHRLMYATHAVVDPILTVTVPKNMTIATGLDAFSQAVEAIWAKSRQFISTQLGQQAIKIIFDVLPRLIDDLENIEYRSQMMKASLLAGLAFSNTRTTAMHSLSYPMTGFFDIPHGIACFLTLTELAKFNHRDFPKVIKDIYEPLGFSDMEEFIEGVEDFAEKLAVKSKLRDYGLNFDDLDQIAENGFTPGRIDNNPRELTINDVKAILEIIY